VKSRKKAVDVVDSSKKSTPEWVCDDFGQSEKSGSVCLWNGLRLALPLAICQGPDSRKDISRTDSVLGIINEKLESVI
jgi:hypothetical protein